MTRKVEAYFGSLDMYVLSKDLWKVLNEYQAL